MSGEAPPLGFNPPRVYVLKEVWDDPQCARRAQNVCDACTGAQVRTFTLDELPDIIIQEKWDHAIRMGCLATVPPPVPILAKFQFDDKIVAQNEKRLQDAYAARGGTGAFNFHVAAGGSPFSFFCSGKSTLAPNPEHICRPQWRIHQGAGCPHQCAYCHLGGYIWTNVNTEEYIEHLGQLLRQNPWQKTWLYDDVMDVPTLEPQLDTLGPLMKFFETTGDRYLIIHTKTDRVESFLQADAPRNTIIAWSLSASTQSRQLEKVAGTTDSRIEAARRCEQAGIQIRYKFKPIIPVPNWREEAAQAIELALRTTRPDNLSMTVMMWMTAEIMETCIPPSLIEPAFLQAARDAAGEMNGSHVGPFPDDVREQIYRHYLNEIRRHDKDVPVTISTESLAMWERMGKDLGMTVANYVCGCGAGAVPGLRTLASNPWQDARQARRWDGKLVFDAQGQFSK